jgi:Tfp pilus assembly protein PilV
MSETSTARMRTEESGFSLVEAIIAVLVFIIGIAAISNLFLVAVTANSTANHAGATATVASEVMDRLRAMSFESLQPGSPSGSPFATSVTAGSTYYQGRRTALLPNATSDTCIEPATANCVTPTSYRMRRVVPGVADVHVNWLITDVGNGVYFITVRAQDMLPVVGERSYVELTSFRAAS